MQSLRAFIARHSSFSIALGVAFAYFLLQLSVINDFGVTWDEPLHRNWGKIFYLFWRSGDRHLLELMPGHGMNYGPLYYLVNYLFSEQLYRAHVLSFVASNHLLNLVVAAGAVGLIFLLGERMFHRRVGFLAVLFFVFFPPLIAHAHYNPKDIPVMTGVLMTAYVFVRALGSGSVSLFVLTGLLLGLSIALKMNALLMLPVCAVSYLLWRWERGESIVQKQSLRTILFVSLAIVFGTIFAWPSAWGDLRLIPQSIHFFLTESFWPGKVLYFGKEYAGADLPWFYSPLEYLMTMPVLMVGFFAVGFWFVARCSFARFDVPTHPDSLPPRASKSVFLLLWIAFPLLVSITPHLVRYDGMRQFFFCLPAIAIVAAVGCDRFLSWISSKTIQPVLVTSVSLLLLLGSLLHEVWIVHPFEGSYRNEVVRFFYPHDLDQVFQIEYWGPSYLQGMEWLVEHAEPNPILCVPTAGILVTWYPWRDDFTVECSALSNYVMFFTRYSEVQQYVFQAMPPVFTIERMGSTLLKMYKVK